MAYKQYTQCVEKDKFDGMCGVLPDLWYALGHGVVGALLAGGAAALILSLLGAGGAFIFGAAVAAGFVYGFFDGLCERYENQRLICIERDQCALGRIAFQEPAPEKSFPDSIDNDYSLNLLLAPHVDIDTKDAAIMWNDGLQGEHLLERKFDDLSYEGYGPPNELKDRYGPWTLHCEFEGSRMHSICAAGKIAAPLVGAALVACAVFALAWWVCALIILAIVLIAFGIGWFSGEDGSPADAAVDKNSGVLEDGDCIVVLGDVVYDAGHCEGWHEIHPVKHVQEICAGTDTDCLQSNCPQGDASDPTLRNQVAGLVDRWCDQLTTAGNPAVIEAQLQPENRWCVHPEIDGCETIIIE